MKKELEKIQSLIYEIRGQRVMLDRDLAGLYGVETKHLNRTVKRNLKRFPHDFMFQLSNKEWEDLRYQIGTAKNTAKARYNPYVFTEQGVAMLSGLLNSDIAITVNIQIMRAFVKLRHYTLLQPVTSTQVAELSKMLMLHIENTDKRLNEHDEAINQIIRVLNNLIEQPPQLKNIGFGVNEKAPVYR